MKKDQNLIKIKTLGLIFLKNIKEKGPIRTRIKLWGTKNTINPPLKIII